MNLLMQSGKIFSLSKDKATQFYALFNIGHKILPYKYFGFTSKDDVPKIEQKEPAIEGYELWLYLLAEACMCDKFLVYYPLNARKGRKIQVICKGRWIDEKFYWVHGQEGIMKEIERYLLAETITRDLIEEQAYFC